MLVFPISVRWWSLLNLSDNKSPQVSRTLLSILTDLWRVSFLTLISHSFSPIFQAFGDRSKCSNYNWYHRHGRIHTTASYFFSFFFSLFFLFFKKLFLVNTGSGLVDRISWSVCLSKSHRILLVSFSWINSGLCIYHLVLWSNFNLLHNS